MIANVLAETIVSRIIEDLVGRKGLGDEWYMIDEGVMDEIVAKWEAIVVAALAVPGAIER